VTIGVWQNFCVSDECRAARAERGRKSAIVDPANGFMHARGQGDR
jgi:hypothetical protein